MVLQKSFEIFILFMLILRECVVGGPDQKIIYQMFIWSKKKKFIKSKHAKNTQVKTEENT